jgi:platelet-activating factor acetylhydrolase
MSTDDMHIPAVWAAEPVQGNELPRMPVIVLTHGLGACRFFYSTLCLQLASFGYFVAAVEHR